MPEYEKVRLVQTDVGLNDLDIAVMDLDELVAWIGRYVLDEDAWPLARWLNDKRPGLYKALGKKYPRGRYVKRERRCTF